MSEGDEDGSGSSNDGCITNSTENGMKCIFPFHYQGNTYFECTSDDHDKPWCAYEVDNDGNLVDDEWENCYNSCDLGIITFLS